MKNQDLFDLYLSTVWLLKPFALLSCLRQAASHIHVQQTALPGRQVVMIAPTSWFISISPTQPSLLQLNTARFSQLILAPVARPPLHRLGWLLCPFATQGSHSQKVFLHNATNHISRLHAQQLHLIQPAITPAVPA